MSVKFDVKKEYDQFLDEAIEDRDLYSESPTAVAVAWTTEELVRRLVYEQGRQADARFDAMCHFHDHELAKVIAAPSAWADDVPH